MKLTTTAGRGRPEVEQPKVGPKGETRGSERVKDTEMVTPETHEFFSKCDWSSPAAIRMAELERERDEARDQVEELTAVIKGLRAIMRQDATK